MHPQLPATLTRTRTGPSLASMTCIFILSPPRVTKWRAAVKVVPPGALRAVAHEPAELPRPIHPGFRADRNFVLDFLNELAGAGVI